MKLELNNAAGVIMKSEAVQWTHFSFKWVYWFQIVS